MAAGNPRTYEVIWRQIKNSFDNKAVVEVIDPAFVPRIKRMVTKEKYMDGVWYASNKHTDQKLYFSFCPKSKQLTIQLMDNQVFWKTTVKNRLVSS